jgi:ectoine hydroxylase-related dioxygenase (phytanoyl-CoA dioxygenase family)
VWQDARVGSHAESITDDLIEAFDCDGVVCLRGVIDADWIDSLCIGVDKNIATPSPRGRVWDHDDHGRTTLYDSQVWLDIEEYRAFVEGSPMAELAGRLMRATAVNFFFDAIFTRTTGAQFRTPFHQDEPFWSVEGYQTCSSWMPLVSVEKKSALEFVRGSHRWNQRYAQTNFGALTGDDRDQVEYTDRDDVIPFPDIESDRDQYDMLSWDMEPGDVAIFNARMIHGGSGNLAPDRDLKVFNTQWLGDDVRIIFRDEGMDPDHRDVMIEHGLAPGDRVSGPLYPEIWRAS